MKEISKKFQSVSRERERQGPPSRKISDTLKPVFKKHPFLYSIGVLLKSALFSSQTGNNILGESMERKWTKQNEKKNSISELIIFV